MRTDSSAVERMAVNHFVGGSIPPLCAKEFRQCGVDGRNATHTGSYNPCAELTDVLAASCAIRRKVELARSVQKLSRCKAARDITRQYRGHSGSSPVSG